MWQGETVDTDHLSELTEEEYEVGYIRSHQKGFPRIDTKYLIPFFTRRFTKQVRVNEISDFKKPIFYCFFHDQLQFALKVCFSFK